jgi:hypothetical protein
MLPLSSRIAASSLLPSRLWLWRSGRFVPTSRLEPTVDTRRPQVVSWRWEPSCSTQGEYRAKAAEFAERSRSAQERFDPAADVGDPLQAKRVRAIARLPRLHKNGPRSKT